MTPYRGSAPVGTTTAPPTCRRPGLWNSEAATAVAGENVIGIPGSFSRFDSTSLELANLDTSEPRAARVLLANVDTNLGEPLRLMLKCEGCEVGVDPNDRGYDLAVLDLRAGLGRGLERARDLLAARRVADVVMITASTEAAELVRAAMLGAVVSETNPIHLVAVVTTTLRELEAPLPPVGPGEILRTVSRAADLPSLPSVVHKVQGELARPEPSLDRLAAAIESDPALTGRLLGLANSALFAPRRPVLSTRDAVVLLGFERIRELVLVAALAAELDGLRSVPEDYWVHSLAVASLCRAWSQVLNPELRTAAFTAGLLHDVGDLVLAHLFPFHHRRLTRPLWSSQRPTHEVEHARWGVDHATIGAALAQRWGLPEVLWEAIRYHHEPAFARASARDLVRLVHLADFTINRGGFVRTATGAALDLDPEVWEGIGFATEQLDELIEEGRIIGGQAQDTARRLALRG